MIMFTNNDLQMLQHFPPIMPSLMERRWNKSNHVEIAPNCPRCASPNTKFCYYNNYSLSQPRYFCKGCRRYWTKGGSLRNVPVGGGCRKYRRSRSKQGSTNFDRKPCNSDQPSTDSASAPNDTGAAEESASIDLAAVYANYLNQNSDSQNKFVADQDVSSGASTCVSSDLPVQNSEISISEYEKSLDLLEEAQLHEDLCMDEDFVIPNVLELQSMLDENISEEMSWIDSVNLPNFTWQSAVQLQEFGSFPHQDQLKISGNLINHNWNNGFIGI